MTLEPFQINYEYGWCLEYLDLLNRLFVHLALVAKPSVLVAKLLRSHELLEAVVDCDFVD